MKLILPVGHDTMPKASEILLNSRIEKELDIAKMGIIIWYMLVTWYEELSKE